VPAEETDDKVKAQVDIVLKRAVKLEAKTADELEVKPVLEELSCYSSTESVSPDCGQY